MGELKFQRKKLKKVRKSVESITWAGSYIIFCSNWITTAQASDEHTVTVNIPDSPN